MCVIKLKKTGVALFQIQQTVY